MVTILTDAHRAYIDANYLNFSSREIGKTLGIHRCAVSNYLKRQKISIPKEVIEKFRIKAMRGRTTVTPEQDEILKAHYLDKTAEELRIMIGGRSETCVRCRMRQLGLIVPDDVIKARSTKVMKKKGDVPFNKGKRQIDYMTPEAIAATLATRFKPGEIPPNKRHYKDGDITIRNTEMRDGTMRPYQYIRVKMGLWRMLHVVTWEAVNGPVPKGCIVVFRNKDTMNCNMDNLEMITLEENMRRNTIQNYSPELRETIMVLHKLNRKIHEKQNR